MGCDGRVSGLLRRNLQPTLTYWSVFFSFGLCIAFLGPTLLDLRCQTHSSLPQISWVFFSQQLCLLLGSALGGVFKRTLAQSLWALFTSSLAISLVFAVIPFCRDVKVLASVMALAGLAMGCIDTVANMQLVRMYQKDSAVFLQVLHFFVGFGALLSPLIADPFLSEANCLPANSTANTTSRGHLFHVSRVLAQHHVEAKPWSNQTFPGLTPKDGAGTRVSYAFWIMALINLPVPMAVLMLLSKERLLTCCPQRRPLLLSADELALETQPPEKEDASSLPPKFQSHPGHEDLFSCCQRKNLRGAPYSFFAIHITAALVLFMTDGLTGAYSAFVYSYAVEKPLSVGHKVAGYLPSLFWGFITLGRLLSIPISSRMKPATMVFINVVGVVVTFLVLLIFSYNVVFLFVGTASLGLFLSSTFPSMLAYTEDSLQYKGCATTVLVTGAGVGEMVLQMLVGSIFQAQGSYSFLVCGVIFGCLAFTFYILLLFFHRMHPGLPSVPTQDRSIAMENSECYQR
ncbi:major facilitator superfamily domain-containing protein 4A [Macaca nemestrina]|uniref:Major facilitator superfamily domain-containing protein 4A n=5 Tax=Cercopithecinae TaxID=9528 RepID=A0A2K5M7R5_CERAT|nr:major facilitator superfamily domain-containing protein 4A [Papio anubis]XP_007986920.1 major facilitator superfamily domain-containing protein 4A [Chlorocebus sabaeus]XP_011745141.1 major facilitator superfamily domain-containing protein 4A [Macaca nemestrina]XP_011894863.1 PREDICTED: major facilitator superfamily domain-containing protein 4 isoform X2 [Cercocebus atys]XP_025219851.1 major facilitator superfamily domain-containing protein 4A isoform X1 [Theropithecus gelada]